MCGCRYLKHTWRSENSLILCLHSVGHGDLLGSPALGAEPSITAVFTRASGTSGESLVPLGDYFASAFFPRSSPPGLLYNVSISRCRGVSSELFLAWRSSAKNKSDASFLGWLPQSFTYACIVTGLPEVETLTLICIGNSSFRQLVN